LENVAKGVVSDSHPTLPEALQLGAQLKGNTYPEKNGSYPQPLADHLNAQCPGLNGRCRPILDEHAEEALCSNSNKRFSAYVFMNYHEARKHNAQGVGPNTGTGWYFVPKIKLGDSSPCAGIANKCSEFHSCRARTQLGTRLVHLNTSDTAGLADVPSFYQCPGSGGTAHAVVQPCLQSTHSVWWNYWAETTKQKWARMLTQAGAKTSANEPDFYRLTLNENGNVVGPQMLARLNSQCDPGKPCQYMNEKGDGYVFRNWATGGGNPQFHWKYVRSAHTQYKNLCQNSDNKAQSYCRKVRDWMCPLGLVYTGNLYGGCFCPLSSSEAPTRTEQRFLSPPNSSVYAGHFRYDVQWREIDKNRYMHLCDKSLSTDSWMHQTYYLSFNELRAKSKNALGHVAYRNHVNMTTSATITTWAQAPQNVERFPHNGNEYGLWYLAGNQNGDSDEDDSTGTQKAYGLSLIYDANVPQLRLSYQNLESSRLSPFSNSGDLADSDAFYHIAICIHPVDPSNDTTPNATADDNGGQAHSKLVLYINGKQRDSITTSHRIRIGGETQGKSLKEIYKSNMNSFLGAAEPNAQKFHVGGLHSFRVYNAVLSQKQIKKDMCTQRSPATTPDLVQAFHFNTGAGNELPNADTSVEKQNKERRDQPIVDSSGLLACPPGYEFKKVQPRKGNETYKLCKRKWTT
jgi:hypothetical protein